MLRILHTADWHLGHSLHGQSRALEHERFLAWLQGTLASERVDVLLVAGDVFDSANPTALAQQQLFGFLARVKKELPGLQVVLTAGNHDSAARLAAPDPILRPAGIRLIGSWRHDAGSDVGDLLLALKAKNGEVAAWLAAVPYLRPADVERVPEAREEPLIAGVRQVYAALLAAAEKRRTPGQALIATGHCQLKGSQISEHSERRIFGGEAHALPQDIFAGDWTYVALGHLHLAQQGPGRSEQRYCGSPIPLSMAEAEYRHQVLLVDIVDGALREVRELLVPRTVELLRTPEEPLPLFDTLAALDRLELPGTTDPRTWPLLEVRVLLDQPQADLRELVEERLAGRPVRLVKITSRYTGDGNALADQLPEKELSELSEQEVFCQIHQRQYGTDPSPDLLAAFAELAEQVHQNRT